MFATVYQIHEYFDSPCSMDVYEAHWLLDLAILVLGLLRIHTAPCGLQDLPSKEFCVLGTVEG